MPFIPRSALILAAFVVSTAQAQVRVSDPWVRATVAQQKATGAFMQLSSPGDTRLVSAASPAAAIVEIHEMAIENDVMRMRQVPALPLPAGKTVALQPGGFHIMLIDLKRQVKPGETVPLTLVFENASGKRERVDVTAPVRSLNATAPAAHPQH
ncbi:copper chaperone PCu(A)C [Massilia sp. S19_KUP03_FR1]|uniref:copper chaperone PCu(A)C n=1 Tax=Massilia sp. S19_KUP03_FR1 TaxID=3025503 RepID=UPI002FCDDF35